MSQTKQMRGRAWSYTTKDSAVAAESATRTFKVYETEGTSPISTGEGELADVPKPGDAHPKIAGLVCDKVEYTEGEGAEGVVVTAKATYSRAVDDTNQIDEWGWDAGTESAELIIDNSATPKKVLNSAGDCFDSVPQVQRYTPTFTKVIKFEARQAGWMAYNCKVNNAQITIGDLVCGAHTLLCSVAEKRLLDDPKWKYSYTIQLKYRSNLIDWQNTGTAEECGWDAVVVDAGMRALYPSTDPAVLTEVLKPITKPDGETNTPTKVSTPQLLDGNGHTYSLTATQTPVYIKFQTYPDTAFPADFYSEPADPAANNPANNGNNPGQQNPAPLV